MLYDKEYFPTDKFDYGDFLELIFYVKRLLNEFQNIIDTTDTDKYPIWLYDWNNLITDEAFLYIEYVDAVERSIKQLAFDFYKPTGYINNKTWIEDSSSPTYKTFNYEDANRIIKDMNLLHKYRNDMISIYNIYTNEYWNGQSSLEWG